MVMGHPRRHMRHTHDFKYYNKVSKHLQTNLYQNHMCSFIYTIKFKQVTGNKNFTNGAKFKIIPTSGSLPLFPAPFQHSGWKPCELCDSGYRSDPKPVGKVKT